MSMTRNTECQRKTSSFSLLISLVLPPAAMGYRNDFGGKASKIVLRNQISNKCFHLFKPSQHLSLYRQTDICWLRHYAEGSFVSLFIYLFFLKSWHTQSVEWGVSEWKATQIVCDYTENTEPFSAQAVLAHEELKHTLPSLPAQHEYFILLIVWIKICRSTIKSLWERQRSELLSFLLNA